MQDQVTINRARLIHPLLRPEVSEIMAEINTALSGRAICRFAYTLRTMKEQDEIYAQGRTKPGKVVTNAKGGQSYHNYGLAIDIVLLVDKDKNGTFESASWETNVDFDGDGQADWREVVAIFKHHGWEWGGDWASFKDLPHFQKTFGYSTAALLKKFNVKQVDSEGYVKL